MFVRPPWGGLTAVGLTCASPQRLIEEDIEIVSVSSKHYCSDWLLCCPVLLACPFLVNSPCREWPQTSVLLPAPCFLCFLSLPLLSLFSPTNLSPRSGRLVFSSRVELGLGCLPAPIWTRNQAEASTHTDIDILTNCRPVLCPHVTACCSGALPHATTHKLGTVASLRFCLMDNQILLSWPVRPLYWLLLGVAFFFSIYSLWLLLLPIGWA